MPSVHWLEFAAPKDAELDDEDAWHAANPGLANGIKSMAYMRDMAAKALANPADESSFRAHADVPPCSSTATIVR